VKNIKKRNETDTTIDWILTCQQYYTVT